jgi:hypothetical protein
MSLALALPRFSFDRATQQEEPMADERPSIITGLFRDRDSAERAYGTLIGRGYGRHEVSLLMSEDTRRRHFADPPGGRTELGTKAAEGAGAGAIAGGGLGALLAGLAASGIAVPGLPIIAMGTLAAALAGAGTGGAIGAIIGGLIGHGIPEDRARFYDRGIREGGIVMGVTPRSRQDAEYFEREWATCGGEQIYCPPLRGRDAA